MRIRVLSSGEMTTSRLGWSSLLGKGRCQKVDKGPHSCGALMTLRINRVNVGVRRVAVGEYLHQASAAKIAVDVPFGTHQDAVPVQRPAHGNLAVVRREIALDLYGFHCGLTPPARR